jgi:general secretion pathway protein J
MRKNHRSRESGFTLIEVLVGLAISSLILVGLSAAMASVNRAFDRTAESISSQNEVSAALDVAGSDISRIEPARETTTPNGRFQFSGRSSELVYVLAERPANNKEGLYWVRLQIVEKDKQSQLIRSRAPYNSAGSSAIAWTDDVILLEDSSTIEFAYRAPRRGLRDWAGEWNDSSSLPEQVRITITDTATERLRVPHFVETLKIETNSLCINPDAPECTGIAQPQ